MKLVPDTSAVIDGQDHRHVKDRGIQGCHDNHPRGRGWVLLEHNRRSFKATLKLADKLAARFVALRGEDEDKRGAWAVRDMAASSQEEVREEGAQSVNSGLTLPCRNLSCLVFFHDGCISCLP